MAYTTPRTLANRAGVTYDATKTTVVYAEDMTVLKDNDAYLKTQIENFASDGWAPTNETWAYASPTTITVPTGAASKYKKGDKIKITQTTVKYFYIIAVADTVLTVTGGSDYSVASATITNNFYSHQLNPLGFPDFFNYVPTLYGSGTNPTMGSGAQLTGIFTIKAQTCIYTYFIKFGTSGVNAGSGAYDPSLPVPVISTGLGRYYGYGVIYDSSLTKTITYMSTIIYGGYSDRIYLLTTNDTSTNISSDAPFVWAASDEVGGTITYEF